MDFKSLLVVGKNSNFRFSNWEREEGNLCSNWRYTHIFILLIIRPIQNYFNHIQFAKLCKKNLCLYRQLHKKKSSLSCRLIWKLKPVFQWFLMNISRNTDNSETNNTIFKSPDTLVFKFGFAYFFTTICSKDNWD